MRHLLCLLALSLLMCGFAFGQTEQPKPAEKNAPTLDETIKWLSQNLPSLASYDGKFEGTAMTRRVVSASFDGCSCTLSAQEETVSSGKFKLESRNSDTYVFSLASLDADKVAVEPVKLKLEPAMFFVRLKAKDDRKAIKRTSRGKTDMLRPTGLDGMESGFVLSLDSEENARRFEKAFKHAIKLCQTPSKEPF